MADHPILFSAPMVRAILAGTKTQTRRISPISDLAITPHGPETLSWRVAFSKPVKGALASYSGGRFPEDQARRIIASQFCKYGKPGDRLWVREAWAYGVHAMAAARDEDGPFVYAADGTTQGRLCDRWRPSIHMPRHASRLLLEIVGVRVERLQDISEADAIAEGCKAEPFPKMWQGYYSDDEDGYLSHTQTIGDDPPDWLIEPKPVRTAHLDRSARDNYRDMWIAINGPDSWEANPWVWAVEFKRGPT